MLFNTNQVEATNNFNHDKIYTYIDRFTNEQYEFYDKETYDYVVNNLKGYRIGGIRWKNEKLGEQYFSHKFISFHNSTPHWGKYSQIAVHNGHNFSISLPIPTRWGTVNVSIGRTESSTLYIPADSKRYSKLALYADITVRRFRMSNALGHKTEYTTKEVHNTYLKPYYK